VKKDEIGRACSMHGGLGMHIEFWGEAIRRLIGRPKRRSKYNIKSNVEEKGWGGIE
jgi:hypothetical protein